MRVGIVAFLQESNTFLAEKTRFRHFAENLLATGEEIRKQLAGSHHEVAGFFEGLETAGLKAVPIFAARALPYGTVDAGDFAELMRQMFAAIEQAGPLDAYLLAPHGATVSEAYPDADGYWMSRLREWVGPKVPLIATADPHANLSPAMVRATDAIISYRTNPHLDQKQRGLEAAELLTRTLRGEVRPTQSAAFPPMLINIDCQHTTAEPCLSVVRKVEEIRQRGGVLSASLFLGFPYADVAEMGAAAVVVTDNQPELAARCSRELAEEMWSRREDLAGHLIGVEEALDQAVQLPGPVCLLDMGDNVGGGAAADGTVLAEAIHRRGNVPAFVCLYDPAAVRDCEQAGVGQTLTLTVGGKSDDQHGSPLSVTITVRQLADGKFSESQARHGGMTHFDQGRTAIGETAGGLTLMLTSERMVPFSLSQLTTFGIDPGDYQLLVAKGVNAPLGAYQAVCPNFIRVNTPGVTTADVHLLPYQHRRRPLYPLEPETEFSV